MEGEGFKAPLSKLGRRKREEKHGRGDSEDRESDLQEKVKETGNKQTELQSEEAEVKVQDDTSQRGDTAGATNDQHTQSAPSWQPQTVSQPPTHSSPAMPYTVPYWSGPLPTQHFSLSVIKNGTIIGEVDISKKAYVVFGRLPECDVSLEHPSISRYHAVLQYRAPSNTQQESTKEEEEGEESRQPLFSSNPKEAGHYIYDLGSTHGTFLNKSRVKPRCYYRVRLGQMIKFGGSSRLFLLETVGGGDQEMVEAEAEQERREIIQEREEYERRIAEAKAEEERLDREREAMGASWGLMMDDFPMEGEGEEYEIDEEKEAYYKDDPKKALKKFFDREGLELEYEVEEEGPPQSKVYTVRVRLPIDSISGEAMAEATVKGKKKEAVVLCALNACRMLDAHDILRQPAKAHKRKKRNWEENDYYDSDEDTFLDRTGTIEQKRKKRMKKAGVFREESESFDTLKIHLSETLATIETLEGRLRKDSQAESAENTVDSLEVYMKTVSDHMDKSRRSEIKHQLHQLRKDEERLRKLINIAKPTDLPSLPHNATHASADEAKQRFTKAPPHTIAKIGHPQRSSSNAPVISRTKASKSSEERVNNSGTQIPSHGSLDSVSSHGYNEPPSSDNSSEAHQQKIMKEKKKKHNVVIGPSLPPYLAREKEKTETEIDSAVDSDFCDWLPPDCQTGDGKTHLNDKFGY